MDLIALGVICASLLVFGHSLFSLYLMLYTWEDPDRLRASRGPASYLPPRLSFTVLLPARDEAAVIYETIKRVVMANYPAHLVEVVVICHVDDAATIAEAYRAIEDLDAPNVRVETFSGGPISKPRGLNVGFQRTTNQVVTIFDAEDDLHPDIFAMVNTVMLEEEVSVVQAGVQLMNYRDHWFSMHNVLEYFFWFKSRLHFHARVGVVPLGGNTVFVRRHLLERVGGWDERCLTEDADLGIRLSALGEPVRIVYDPSRVTREETPESVSSLIRQRTRWHQGFLQVLRKGVWRALPRFGQRLLALMTLSHPFLQAVLTLLWPLAFAGILWVKLPIVVTMVSFLPLYALLFQLLATVVGSVMFAREYGFRLSPLLPLVTALTFLPYQLLLGLSAVRAVYRELRNRTNWEKTPHVGAHRRPSVVRSAELAPRRARVEPVGRRAAHGMGRRR
uniref:Glycosyltransferase n=1 Tax=Thermorudis sp. TaxID=1969470 RepID=A0A7C3ARJ7_9BACT